MKILIVDDCQKDREKLICKIKKWGTENSNNVTIQEMDHVACSSPAMRSIQDVDVLILDVEMPGIDGMTFPEGYRAQCSFQGFREQKSHSASSSTFFPFAS